MLLSRRVPGFRVKALLRGEHLTDCLPFRVVPRGGNPSISGLSCVNNDLPLLLPVLDH